MNKHILKHIILFAMAVAHMPLHAHSLTPNEALLRFMNGKRAHKMVGQGFTLRHTEKKGALSTVYVFSGSRGGTYLLSADDCAPAVLGWTDDVFQDSLPEPVKWWIGQYSEGIAEAVNAGRAIRRAESSQPAVEPLLSTTWAQCEPYNNLCNDVEDGCQTGCVATAMAQIMKYYNYPEKGVGQNTYTIPIEGSNQKISVSSDFSAHTYQWDKMLDYYKRWGNGDEQEAAVALLMRDCGVALEMNYGKTASSASNAMVAYALMTYFGYDKAMENKYRNFMTDEEWENLLITELEAKRPVFYSGACSNSGGHAFVCDGYDGNGYFHFNWGWEGGCDGYFLVTGAGALNPYKSLDEYAYTTSQMITIGIQPDCGGKKKAGTMEFFQPYTINNTYVYRGNFFLLSDSYVINRSMSPMHAAFGARLVKDGEAYDIKGYNSEGTYDLKSSYMISSYIYVSEVPKNGIYEVYPIYMDLDEEKPQWRVVQYPADQVVPTIEIMGTEPDMLIEEEPYVYGNGVRNLNNKAIEDDLTIHLKLKILKDITNYTIICTLYDKANQTNVAYGDGVYTAKEGDMIEIDLKPEKYYYMNAIPCGTYSLIIKAQYRQLNPSRFNNLPITIVDHLPTTIDVPKMVDKALNGEATKQDVEDTVNDILNTLKLSK